jgi:serine/threonine protein kinase/Tfp pilus assembly protein PilF
MAKPQSDSLVGTRIREYEILEVIGKGGMGAVYRARHVLLDEERAIKVVHSRFAGETDLADRFIREAKVLIRLRHPNLVQLFEFGTLEADTFFMVLELIRGESVLQRIRTLNRIPIEQAIKIVREAAQGLHSAHQKGIIHRDLSPDNLLIVADDTGEEITKVIDFGIAKPLFEGTQHTVANMVLGKLEYCSPEQSGALAGGETIDHRSDIYSLGITFYYMLTGELPFFSATPQGYLFKHIHEVPKAPSSHFPAGEFPGALDRVVLKALSKNREERQSSMAEFARELHEVSVSFGPTIIESSILVDVPTSKLKPGDEFGNRYVIAEKLGEGGMGVVYKATDKILNVSVALKILNPKLLHEAQTVERLKREVILARKVAHPNVCRIYDIGESKGIHYISMELLQGQSLAEVVKKQGALPIDAGLTIIKQMLRALAEAHRVGIIHRDLKPQNIMVGENLVTSIMDFGISTSSELGRLTQANALVGTPRYMAPEQIMGKTFDQRADIYSIGMIMYEVFTGRLPFNAITLMETIYAQLKSAPIRPSEFRPDIPADLEQITLRCLEKDPENRFTTVRELLDALEPLAKTGTDLLAQTGEMLVHKYLAQRNYRKAIDYLEKLILKDPQSQEWPRLLEVARRERAKEGLSRAGHYIRRKDLARAEQILRKLEDLALEDPRMQTQIRKLNTALQRKRFEGRVQQVRKRIGEALQPLSAQKFQNSVSLIAALAEEISEPPLRNEVEFIRSSIEKIGQDLTNSQFAVAVDSIDKLLEGRPYRLLGPHQKLLRELQEIAREQDEKFRLFQTAVQKGEQCFDASRWEEAIEHWEEAQKTHPEDENLRAWLETAADRLKNERELRHKVAGDLQDCERLIEEKDFEQAKNKLNEIEQILSTPGFSEYREEYSNLRRLWHDELQKENERYKKSQDELTQTIQLRASGDLQTALAKVEWLLQQEPGLEEALRIRDEIHRELLEQQRIEQKFEAAVERGKDLSDQMQWEEAIRSWQEALQWKPDDPKPHQLIHTTEECLKREDSIRKDLAVRLAECEQSITEKQFEKAKVILEQIRSKLSEPVRLGDFQQQSAVLEDRLKREFERETARSAAIQKDLQKAQALLQRQEFQPALVLVESVLQRDPQLAEAQHLLSELQRKISDRVLGERVAKELAGIVEELVAGTSDVQPRLKSLKEAVRNSPYERESHAMTKEIQELSKAVQKGRLDQARMYFQQLSGITLFRPHIDNVDKFLKHLEQQRDVTLNENRTEDTAVISTRQEPGAAIPEPRTWRFIAYSGLVVLVFAIAMTLWWISGSSSNYPFNKTDKLLAQATALSSAGKIEESLKLLQQYVDQHPNDPRGQELYSQVKTKLLHVREEQRTEKIKTLLATARKQVEAGQSEEALKSLRAVLEIDPLNQESQEQMAQVERKLAQQKSQLQLQQEIEERLKEAEENLKASRLLQARNQLNEVLQLQPENHRAKSLLNEVQAKLKQTQAEQDRLAKIKTLIASASTYSKQGDYEKAASLLKGVLQLDPGNNEATSLLAQMNTELQKPRYGEISIICEPFCMVYMDGQDWGTSPISRRKIQTGKHTISVRKSGYQEKNETVVVKENQPVDLNFTLRKLS